MFHGDMFMAVNAAFRSRESRSEGHVGSVWFTVPVHDIASTIASKTAQLCRRRVNASRYANYRKHVKRGDP